MGDLIGGAMFGRSLGPPPPIPIGGVSTADLRNLAGLNAAVSRNELTQLGMQNAQTVTAQIPKSERTQLLEAMLAESMVQDAEDTLKKDEPNVT